MNCTAHISSIDKMTIKYDITCQDAVVAYFNILSRAEVVRDL
jgi:hypothetical protein